MIDNAIILTKEEYENAKNNIRNSAYRQGRADAIEEFANKLLQIVSDNYCYPYFENAIYGICNDAIVDTKEQMQKGKENE